MDSNIVSTRNPEFKAEKKGISGSTLKLIAIITMLIDHIGASILERMLSARGAGILDSGSTVEIQEFLVDNGLLYGMDFIMRMIGRVAFPIFCFLLVEGMTHTHNKWKYAGRLAIFALISEIPFDLAFNGKPFYWGSQNVFFTLLIGLLVMLGFQVVSEKLNEKKWLPVLAAVGAIPIGCMVTFYVRDIIKYVIRILNANEISVNAIDAKNINTLLFVIFAIAFSVIAYLVYIIMYKKLQQAARIRFVHLAVLAVGMAVAELLKTDYSGFGVLAIAVMYGLRRNYYKSMFGGCITLTIMSLSEAPAFMDLILIKNYNGKRGLNLKYVFYLFYPVHLFLLYLIYYFINL